MQRLKKIGRTLMQVVGAALALCLPVSAAVPMTGDERGRRMWIFIVLLVLAVVAIVAVLVTGSKSRGKKKK